ncbi:MAG TPA: hypothetical protein DHW07_06760 [Gammaproteobacteria bacterium]|nr:hypothetical protein [Gammaproteobacteria bacterium]
MSSSLILLTITYAFGLFVLLLFLIQSRLQFSLRIFVILAGTAFYLVHFFSLDALRGWPTDSPLPEKFTLHAWRFQEPNPVENQFGYIYLWVQAQDWEHPRAYTLPYSSELHDRLEVAQARRDQGYLQKGRKDSGGSVKFSDTSRRLPTKKSMPSEAKS